MATTTRALVLALLAALLATPAAAADQLLELKTARGSTLRVVLDVPPNPVGSVVLLAGGDGVLDIDATGRIKALRGNQLVRTRAMFAAAGYAVAVPDIAADFKGRTMYRADAKHGQDVALVIQHMRGIKGPVALIGTSRGAITAATTMLKQRDALPDALVITSGMLRGNFSAETMGDPAGIKVPVLLIVHQDDTCKVTPPGEMPNYAARLTGARKVDTMTMTGGTPLRGDPCEADGPHGFLGLDQQVVQAVTGWLKANMR